MITNPVYFDVAHLLANNGFGALGTDIFGGEWGSKDGADIHKQILVIDGPGTPSDLKETYEQPGVQILVRGNKKSGGTDYADIEVYRRAKAISDFLLGLSDAVEINGVCYRGFEESTNIAPLGKDENERFVYSMNFFTYRNR